MEQLEKTREHANSTQEALDQNQNLSSMIVETINRTNVFSFSIQRLNDHDEIIATHYRGSCDLHVKGRRV